MISSKRNIQFRANFVNIYDEQHTRYQYTISSIGYELLSDIRKTFSNFKFGIHIKSGVPYINFWMDSTTQICRDFYERHPKIRMNMNQLTKDRESISVTYSLIYDISCHYKDESIKREIRHNQDERSFSPDRLKTLYPEYDQMCLSMKSPRVSFNKRFRDIVWDTHIGSTIGSTYCPLCNRTIIQKGNFVCAHVIPLTHYGANSLCNIRPTCKSCDREMETLDMHTFAQRRRYSSDYVIKPHRT